MERKYNTDQENVMKQGNGTGQGMASGQGGGGPESKYCQVRRVGSLTFGVALICYGILFLVHIFMPVLGYRIIFRCWPVVFILLGVEILVENYKCRTQEWKMVYDFAAILMLGAMLLFAMVMAVLDYAVSYGTIYF